MLFLSKRDNKLIYRLFKGEVMIKRYFGTILVIFSFLTQSVGYSASKGYSNFNAESSSYQFEGFPDNPKENLYMLEKTIDAIKKEIDRVETKMKYNAFGGGAGLLLSVVSIVAYLNVSGTGMGPLTDRLVIFVGFILGSTVAVYNGAHYYVRSEDVADFKLIINLKEAEVKKMIHMLDLEEDNTVSDEEKKLLE